MPKPPPRYYGGTYLLTAVHPAGAVPMVTGQPVEVGAVLREGDQVALCIPAPSGPGLTASIEVGPLPAVPPQERP